MLTWDANVSKMAHTKAFIASPDLGELTVGDFGGHIRSRSVSTKVLRLLQNSFEGSTWLPVHLMANMLVLASHDA